MKTFATAPDGSLVVHEVEGYSEKDEQEFVSKLIRSFETAKQDRSDIERSWKRSVKAYRSRLMEDENRNEEESALDMPIIKTMSQQTEARLINPILQEDPIFTAKPRKPQHTEVARQYEDLADFIVDRSEWRKFLTYAARIANVFSKVVVQVGWEIKQRHIKQWKKAEEPIIDEVTGLPLEIEGPDGLPTGDYQMREVYVEEEADVTDWQGARPRIVPTERFFHPIPTDDLDEAPWVAEQCFLSKYDIAANAKRGIYRKDAAKKLKNAGDAKPDQDFSLSGHKKETEKGSSDDSGQYEVLEFYTTLSYFDDEAEDTEVIITVEKNSKTVLRFVYNWYHEYPRGFLTWSYEDVPGDVDGISLAYQLEPIHRAISASVNQRLDAASKSQHKTLFANTNGELSEKCRDGHIPHGMVEVNSVTDLQKSFFDWSPVQPYTQLDQLESYIEKFGDRLASLNLGNFGVQEIDRPNATGQMALLEEGKMPLFMLLESFRKFNADALKLMVSRYRQFLPAGIEMYIETDETGGLKEQLLSWPDGYWNDQVIFETTVSSEKMSKMVRRQEMMAWIDKFPQIIETYMGLAQAATTPQPIAKMAEELLMQYYEVFRQMLREFDMDQRRAVNPKESIDAGKTWQMAMQQMQQQLMQLQQALGMQQGPGGPGGPGGPVPAGPPGAAGMGQGGG